MLLSRCPPIVGNIIPTQNPPSAAGYQSDDADFITGQVISVSGGLTMHG